MHPNVTTAALYLASASTVPISLDVVAAVNATLCVAASPTVARTVAAQAESAGSEMSR